MTMKVIILPFDISMVKGKIKLTTHSKCVSIMIKTIIRYAKHVAMALTYGVL